MSTFISKTSFVTLVAHRGVSLYKIPENTPEAIEQAFKLGVEIETDIQKINGGFVLYHDENIPGPNDNSLNGGGFYLPSGKKPIPECTLRDLLIMAQFDRGKHETILSKQAGEKVILTYKEEPRIATLGDLIYLLKKYPKAKVHLEIKRPIETEIYNDGLEEELIGILKDENLVARVIIISFNESSLKNIRKANSSIKLGVDIYGKQALDLQIAKRMKDELAISYWNPPFKQVNQSTIGIFNQIEKLGLDVIPWPWIETKKQELDYLQILTKTLRIKSTMTNQFEIVDKIINQST